MAVRALIGRARRLLKASVQPIVRPTETLMKRAPVTIAFVLTLASFATTACGKEQAAPPAAGKNQQAEELRHAATAVVPGSHEDWCGEHGVPESQCTRCNPSLIAAFKATGDWCEEHGVPESQCLKCNPNLQIRRPPKAE